MPAVVRRTSAFSAALLALVAAAVPASAAAPDLVHGKLAAGRAHPVDPHGRAVGSTSTNWAGYTATGGRYTSVAASWTEPTVSCGGTAYSSFWTGLDGDGSSTVEQAGAEADCSGATPRYFAWYEMYPAFPVNLSDPVQAGDRMTTSVTSNGSGAFTLTLTDSTQGWSHSYNKRLASAKLASAEVITEAPSSGSGVLPLADFGLVNFSGATVNGAALSGANPSRVTMESGSTVKASTSPLSGGEDFTVTWQHS
jgi:hypothetical protein